jgi:hypothetical protein
MCLHQELSSVCERHNAYLFHRNDILFDEAHCSRYGMTFQDLEENERFHRELLPLQKQNKRLSFNTLTKERVSKESQKTL